MKEQPKVIHTITLPDGRTMDWVECQLEPHGVYAVFHWRYGTQKTITKEFFNQLPEPTRHKILKLEAESALMAILEKVEQDLALLRAAQ